MHRTTAAPFTWVPPFALSAARSMRTSWLVGSAATLAQVSTAVEEHGRRILEVVISDEVTNLELDIALQMFRERVDRLDERMHEFRQSQELQ